MMIPRRSRRKTQEEPMSKRRTTPKSPSAVAKQRLRELKTLRAENRRALGDAERWLANLRDIQERIDAAIAEMGRRA